MSGFFFAVFLGCLLLGGCGGKQDVAPEEMQVLGITITPVPTPTRMPYALYPKAAVTKDNITFVNEYLLRRS